MTLLGQIDPLNFASLKPVTANSLMQEEQAAAQTQAAQAQAQYNQTRLVGEQQEQQRNADFTARLSAMAKAPSVEGYTQLLAVAPKEYVEGLKASITQMSVAARETLANQIIEPWLAGVNGNPGLMKSKLRELELGYESKGDQGKAAGIRDIAAQIDKNPNIVTGRLGHDLLEAIGPEKFNALLAAQKLDSQKRREDAEAILAASRVTDERLRADRDEAIAKAKKEGNLAEVAAIEKAYAERQQIQKLAGGVAQEKADLSRAGLTDQQREQGKEAFPLQQRKLTAETTTAEAEAEVARRQRAATTKTMEAEAAAAADAQRLKKETAEENLRKTKAEVVALGIAANKLDPGMRDKSLEAIKAGKAAQAKAELARSIKAGYEKIAPSWKSSGAGAEFNEWWKKVSGTEDKVTELRRLANYVITGDVIEQAQFIRPVSNDDTKMLREGLPSATSNPKRVIAYMEALERVLTDQAAYQLGMSAWINKNKGPEDAQADFEINGRKVSKGTSFVDFLDRGKKAREALAKAMDPSTSPANKAYILAKLKELGEDTSGQ